MKSLVSLAGFAALALILAGCAAQTKYVPTAAPLCKAVQPVCIDKDDVLTEPTASQIEANNLGMTKVCKVRKNVCKL